MGSVAQGLDLSMSSKCRVESTDLGNGVKKKAFGERLDAEKERHSENYLSFRRGMLVISLWYSFYRISTSNHHIISLFLIVIDMIVLFPILDDKFFGG